MQPQSKLSAVNACLMAASEAPVSTLDGNAGLNVQQAIAVIDEVSRRLQQDGWSFNTFNVDLVRDVNNKIPVPADYVSIDWTDPAYTSDKDISVRGGYLWDVNENTDIWDGNVTVKVIRLLDWDDLPIHARDYIQAKSIRMYTDRTVGNATLGQFTRQDEQETWARFRRTELQLGDYKVLDSETYRRIILRRI